MSKSPFFVNFHLIRSPFSFWGKLDPKVRRNSSTTPNSQSFGSLIKRTFQLLYASIPNRSRDEAIDASLLVAIPNTTRKDSWSGKSPHHQSVQDFTLSPTPTSNRIFLLKTSQPLRILLYKPHPCTPLPSLEDHPPHSSPNFKTTTLLQSHVSTTPNRHNHFPSKALLKVVNFLTPKPPFAIGAHTLSHPTKCASTRNPFATSQSY